MGLKKQTYIALLWSFIDRAGDQIVRFVFSIVLARLLMPADFGLVGMACVIVEISKVFAQGGLGLGLINKKNATRVDESSVFFTNIVLGIATTLLLYFSASMVGKFYKNELITPLVKALSWGVLLNSIGNIQTVLMTKNIDFKVQTIVSVSVTLVAGGTGIGLAYMGMGVWALVWQGLIRSFLYSSLMWLVYSWRPSFCVSFSSIKNMFNFGYKVMLGNLAQIIYNNIFTILIGKLFSPAQLGYYTRAQQTQQLPLDTIWTIIWRVTFPVMSTIKNDDERFRQALAHASKNLAFVLFPSLIMGVMVAPGLFRILFGEKWVPSIFIFQILCLSSLCLPLENLRNSAILAKGNSALQLKLITTKYVTTILSVFVTFRFGITVMLVGIGIVWYLNFLLNCFFTKKEIGYRLRWQFLDLFPCMICTLLSAAAIYLLSLFLNTYSIAAVASELFCGLFVYIATCYILNVDVFFDNLKLVSRLVDKFKNG